MIQGVARRPLWSQALTVPVAHWMPIGWRPAALTVIKALHTVIFRAGPYCSALVLNGHALLGARRGSDPRR